MRLDNGSIQNTLIAFSNFGLGVKELARNLSKAFKIIAENLKKAIKLIKLKSDNKLKHKPILRINPNKMRIMDKRIKNYCRSNC